jgi:hypothetical protein
MALYDFSRAPGIVRTLPKEGRSAFAPVLTMTVLLGVIALDTATAVLQLSRMRYRIDRVARGAGILLINAVGWKCTAKTFAQAGPPTLLRHVLVLWLKEVSMFWCVINAPLVSGGSDR